MGFNRSWCIFWVILSLSSLSVGHSSNVYNKGSLDTLILEYAQKALAQPHTGTLYKVSLPANFSGMEVSAIRLRSGSFWTRGANFSSILIPPRIIPMPFVKRLGIVYENMGNWSSYYYEVPGYSLVSPVVGFKAYDASNSNAIGSTTLRLIIKGDPFSIHFPYVVEPEDKNLTMKCAKFGLNGSLKLSNMTMPNVCIARGQGHFAIVASSPPKKKKERLWKWWVIGFGAGFVGLVLVCLVGIMIFKLVKRKKMKEMERESAKGLDFNTIWIDRSKMPSATTTRTQPVLENDYVP